MQLSEQTDVELAGQIQSGHDDAFDELMRRYKQPVLNFVHRLLGRADDAEDVAEEVFVRVYQHIGEYRPATKFSTWLFALARNAAIDRLRWRQRRPTESLDGVAEVALATTATAAEHAQAREIGERIAAAVAELPEDQRTVLVLSEYHDQSYAAIAAIMRCSEKSAEARLRRAKLTLRERLRSLLE